MRDLFIAQFFDLDEDEYIADISLAYFLWDIGKQCKTTSDAAYSSDQALHCLLTEVSIKF